MILGGNHSVVERDVPDSAIDELVPVTIHPPAPNSLAGPWISVALESDFIGPLPIGSFWRIQLYTSPEPNPLFTSWDADQDTASPFSSHLLYDRRPLRRSALNTSVSIKAGDQVHITAELRSPSSVLDSGTITIPWDPVIGQQALPTQIQAGTGGGLTNEQALQLSQTHVSTFTDQLVDTLTLIPLTAGPSPGPINTVLTDTVFGVIVRLASIPPDLVAGTPDGDYWTKTLAVVRIFRGSDLWKRYPIHTSSKLISFASENIVAAVTALTATQWLLNMTMQVTFLPGVTGQVFLMRFP